jgi:hypothetical protein
MHEKQGRKKQGRGKKNKGAPGWRALEVFARKS